MKILYNILETFAVLAVALILTFWVFNYYAGEIPTGTDARAISEFRKTLIANCSKMGISEKLEVYTHSRRGGGDIIFKKVNSFYKVSIIKEEFQKLNEPKKYNLKINGSSESIKVSR